ncbi:MAG: hypothetical protein WC683_06770 [bacterium]
MATRSWKAKLGHLITVPNRNRKFGEARHYVFVRAQDEDGKEGGLLFTPNALSVARERARKNPEDVLKAAWLVDALD